MKTEKTKACKNGQNNTTKIQLITWEGPPLADARVVTHPAGNLLVLDAEGGLHFVDTGNGSRKYISTASLPALVSNEENPYFGSPRFRLHVSADCSRAAVVVDRGSEGILVDIATGRSVKRLADDNYHSDTVPFSACFIQQGNSHILIHRTAWNRLDACDAATGELLTGRSPTSYTTGEDRPTHYLDYFHGGLLPSPDGKLLFDDGWVWHPIAVPRIFSIEQWLGGNVWESEDGPSVRELLYRDDWNVAACWIDASHIALSGIGTWDREEFMEVSPSNGIRIMNVHGEFGEAPRPSDRLIPMPDPVLRLFADGSRLHAVSAEKTSTWHIASGECVAEAAGFPADLFDPERRLFIRILPGEIQTCLAP